MANEKGIDQDQYFQAIVEGVEHGFLKAIQRKSASEGTILEAISQGIHSSFWGYLDHQHRHIDDVLRAIFIEWLDSHKKEIIEAIKTQGTSSNRGKRRG